MGRRKRLQAQIPVKKPLVNNDCIGVYDETMHSNPAMCLECINNKECQEVTANKLLELMKN